MQELPALIETDPEVQRLTLQLTQKYFAGRSETESRFDRVLEELRQMREEQTRRWEEQTQRWAEQAQRWAENQKEIREMLRRLGEMDERHAEIDRKWAEQIQRWEEQNRQWQEQAQRWAENDRRWEENQKEIREMLRRLGEMDERYAEFERKWLEQARQLDAVERKFDSTIGALGARWGLHSEETCRSALRGILTDFFNLEVVQVNEYDETGEVFGRPEQIELDLIINNGTLLICEIKSSMSKADMYLFERKVRWYERRHERKADQLMVISPMVDARARKVAERFNIVVYSFADDAGMALTVGNPPQAAA
ncbi:MAG: PD-(D/E)XK nuclease family protein, partial [Chloroflexus sp.]|uniref:PD-(D/E)XK nuclease family protein n=2 Tax=Chloroflexus sp. TaxID=1904827 RepID=UPI00404A3E89